MFPFWYELSGSQLLQWTASAVALLLCLVNLAAGQTAVGERKKRSELQESGVRKTH